MLSGMMKLKNIKIGTIVGIPVLVNPSWFVMVVLTVWFLAFQLFPDQLQDRGTATYLVMAVCSVYFFFMSIVFHELAHSIVARAYRIPVQSITLFILGGVAHITREAAKPLPELLMAIAGPLTSFAIGAICAFAWISMGRKETAPLDIVILWLAITNIALGIFNLLPAFPMDGGRVFRSILWLFMGDQSAATQVAAWTGRAFGWTFITLGLLAVAGVDVRVASGIGGLWLVVIGWFLENAARQGLFQNRVVRELQKYAARDLMLANPPIVDAQRSVASLARGVLELNPRVCYFVRDAGRLAGILSAYQMRAIHEAMWDSTTAGEVMVPSARLHPVPPDRQVHEILMDMEGSDLTHLPVVRNGDVVGVIGRDRILGVLQRAGYLRDQGLGVR